MKKQRRNTKKIVNYGLIHTENTDEIRNKYFLI